MNIPRIDVVQARNLPQRKFMITICLDPPGQMFVFIDEVHV